MVNISDWRLWSQPRWRKDADDSVALEYQGGASKRAHSLITVLTEASTVHPPRRTLRFFFFPPPLIGHLNFYRAPDLCCFSSTALWHGIFFPSKLKNEPFYISTRVLQQRLTHLCRRFSLTQIVRRHQRLRSGVGHRLTHTKRISVRFTGTFRRSFFFFSFYLSQSSSTKFSPFGSYYWWKWCWLSIRRAMKDNRVLWGGK